MSRLCILEVIDDKAGRWYVCVSDAYTIPRLEVTHLKSEATRFENPGVATIVGDLFWTSYRLREVFSAPRIIYIGNEKNAALEEETSSPEEDAC